MLTIANAPVSYGVFGLARPDLVASPGGEEILDAVATAGYAGIDLGDPGFLGTGSDLIDNLGGRGLGLAGGWLDFPFTSSEGDFTDALTRAEPVLADMALAAKELSTPPPKPTLADSGSAKRQARPGGGPDLELDAEGWAVFLRRLDFIVARIRDMGLEPTFHHHACTYVETPQEIDRLLEGSDIGLTFDSGHLLIGGGDPLDVGRWAGRINHLHLKDARMAVLREALGTDNPRRDIWERRVFVPLGEGDLDVAGLVDQIRDFDGWLVIEQDAVLLKPADLDRAKREQEHNLSYLKELL